MATVKIEIDTEAGEVKSEDKKRTPLASDKVGLLSTIALSQDLIDAFEIGLGTSSYESELESGYKKPEIKDKKSKLKFRRCKVIATSGGLVAFYALNDESPITMPPFVSLVGNVPAPSIRGECKGGVSLESYKSNHERITYLTTKGHNPANICLLTNRNSQMHGDERTDWNNINPNNGTFLESYVGDGAGNNDATKFAWDFSGGGGNAPTVPGNATALIISGDPYFQAKQVELVTQVNFWLGGGGNRHVVYPSTSFVDAAPASGQSTLLAPDLSKAYLLLGMLANCLNNNKGTELGFFTVPNQTVPL